MTVSHEIRLGQPSAGTTLNNGLVHAYKMDETSGNRVDSVGTAHLTLATFGGGSNYVTGKDGNAFDSNSGAYGLYVARSSIHPGTDFTYSGWFSRQGADTAYTISVMDDTGGWSIDIASGTITYRWGASSVVDTLTVGTGWRLVTWWGSTSSMGLRVDTRSAQTGSKSGTTLPSINLEIGFNEYVDEGAGYAWDGYFDDLCVWNRVLTSSEIEERAGKYYPFT